MIKLTDVDYAPRSVWVAPTSIHAMHLVKDWRDQSKFVTRVYLWHASYTVEETPEEIVRLMGKHDEV